MKSQIGYVLGVPHANLTSPLPDFGLYLTNFKTEKVYIFCHAPKPVFPIHLRKPLAFRRQLLWKVNILFSVHVPLFKNNWKGKGKRTTNLSQEGSYLYQFYSSKWSFNRRCLSFAAKGGSILNQILLGFVFKISPRRRILEKRRLTLNIVDQLF